MSAGALLAALALAVVVAAYLARPFRSRGADWAVEAWIERARAANEPGAQGRVCPQCGYPLEMHHRYCPQCGAELPAVSHDANE